MIFKFPAYFFQSEKWAKFWLEASLPGHAYFKIETKRQLGSFTFVISAIVYKYPWFFGLNHLYLAKAPALSVENIQGEEVNLPENFEVEKENILKLFTDFLEKTMELAKAEKSVFIKADFDHQVTNLFGILDNSELVNFLKNNLGKPVTLSSKVIQYLSTITLDTRLAQSKFNTFIRHTLSASQTSFLSKDKLGVSLLQFFEQSSEFWKTTNSNIRRYTRKSLQIGWVCDELKSESNFEDFWEVYSQTSKRQKFTTYSKSYTKQLYDKDFSHIILLRDENGVAQSCWIGIESENTLTYLYGGNTEKGLEKYGQYLIHLVAVRLCVFKKLRFYDLGGYDSRHGYGKFKEGFHGEVRNFLGPVDILLQPSVYNVVSGFVFVVKKIVGFTNKSNHSN